MSKEINLYPSIKSLNFKKETLLQKKLSAYAHENNYQEQLKSDIIINANTGSGKTAGILIYLSKLIISNMKIQTSTDNQKNPITIILVPTEGHINSKYSTMDKLNVNINQLFDIIKVTKQKKWIIN